MKTLNSVLASKRKSFKKESGFTLIEILVVIGIIAILAAIVIIAINPARQFAQARNTQRQANIDTILNAVGQNIADNKGVFICPTMGALTAATSTQYIGTGAGNHDLTNCLSTYISAGIPVDPDGGTPGNTGYVIGTTTTNQFMVCAPKSSEPALGNPSPLCVIR